MVAEPLPVKAYENPVMIAKDKESWLSSSIAQTTFAVCIKYRCPPKYCKDPSGCMEYPFSSTKDKVPRKYRCVPSEELKMLDYMLTSAYTSGRITDGSSFYVGVSNIPDSGCV